MTFYFHVIRQVDILVTVALLRFFQKFNRSIKCVLLITKYPQFSYDEINLGEYFDRVYWLPYCGYFKNIIKGYRDCRRHYRELSRIEIEKDAAFFLYDDSELSCLNIYRFTETLRREGMRVKTIHLVYVASPIKYDLIKSVSTSLAGSLLLGAYSIPLFRKAISYRYLKGVNFAFDRGVNFDVFDKEVFFYRRSPAGFESEFDNMYVPFTNKDLFDKNVACYLDDNSVIFLVSNLSSCMKNAGDWERLMNSLLLRFREQFTEYKLYVKLHPLDSLSDYKNISFERFELIDQKVSWEKILGFNRENIKAVYSFLSSANFASSALGIPSYYLYPLLGLDPHAENYWDKLLLDNSLSLKKIKDLSEINRNNLDNFQRSDFDNIENQKKWFSLYKYLKA